MGQAEVHRPLEDQFAVMEVDLLDRRRANGIQQLVRVIDTTPCGVSLVRRLRDNVPGDPTIGRVSLAQW